MQSLAPCHRAVNRRQSAEAKEEDKTVAIDKGAAIGNHRVGNAAGHLTTSHNKTGEDKDTRQAHTNHVLSDLVVLQRDPIRM